MKANHLTFTDPRHHATGEPWHTPQPVAGAARPSPTSSVAPVTAPTPEHVPRRAVGDSTTGVGPKPISSLVEDESTIGGYELRGSAVGGWFILGFLLIVLVGMMLFGNQAS